MDQDLKDGSLKMDRDLKDGSGSNVEGRLHNVLIVNLDVAVSYTELSWAEPSYWLILWRPVWVLIGPLRIAQYTTQSTFSRKIEILECDEN